MLLRRFTLLTGALLIINATASSAQDSHWPAYGGDAGGTRYAELAQINRENVNQLEVAWTYRTGELGEDARAGHKLTFEATPVLFDGTLYLSTGYNKVIALDPASGEEQWTFDPEVDRSRSFSEITSRGVAAWDGGEDSGLCSSRIFIGTIDARLIALDAATGAPCSDFGQGGIIDLAGPVGMQRNGDYQVTSPPAIVNDLVIVGTSIGDNWSHNTGPGVVRAYDVRTGEMRWDWHPLQLQDDRTGAANAWAPMSADPKRDLVFVPTSSPSPDFFGGWRTGDNRYANSVVALRASTGEVVWHFQTVHHDLWDYDIAAQPALIDVIQSGELVPAVAQATKMGVLFLLHRETGEPLIPVEERPVPQSDVAGESSWATQPYPVRPRPLLSHAPFTPENVWGLNDQDRTECLDEMRQARSEGTFTPPSLDGTIMFPGNGAGTNWGSTAFHAGRGRLVLNTTHIATYVQLLPREEVPNQDAADRLGSNGPFEYSSQGRVPYGMRRTSFTSSRGVPCNPPPWGKLSAIDLPAGEIAWEIPIGRIPEWHPLYEDATAAEIVGVPMGGGPIVTSGDLIFIGATMNSRFRALDVETGEELWSTALPHSAIATPMTYEVGGRQYVVTVAGGHGKMGLPVGDFVFAFALPR